MNDADRELIEFTKDSVRQILSPKLSKASIISAGCLIAYILIHIPTVTQQLTFLPKNRTAVIACDLALLAISAMFGFSAVRKRFARGRFIGAVCMVVSILLLLRQLQQFL